MTLVQESDFSFEKEASHRQYFVSPVLNEIKNLLPLHVDNHSSQSQESGCRCGPVEFVFPYMT